MAKVSLPLKEEYKNSLSEITTDNNDLIGYGRISGIFPDALELSPSRREDDLPNLVYGTSVKVNIYNSKLGFKVFSGVVHRSSDALLRIAALELLVNTDRRQFFRIKIKARSDATLLSGEVPANMPPGKLKVHVEDISLSGIQIATPVCFAEGSKLRLELALEDTPISLQCSIQRIVKVPDEENRSYYYGCQYLPLKRDQEELLHKALLRLQQSKRARYNR